MNLYTSKRDFLSLPILQYFTVQRVSGSMKLYTSKRDLPSLPILQDLGGLDGPGSQTGAMDAAQG